MATANPTSKEIDPQYSPPDCASASPWPASTGRRRRLLSARPTSCEGWASRQVVTLVTVPGAGIAADLAGHGGERSLRCAGRAGCVIRGETYHFEIVANESARGIIDVQLHTGVPIANGAHHRENDDQARPCDGSRRGRRPPSAPSRWSCCAPSSRRPTPLKARRPRPTVARRRAREFVVQGLYQWQVGGRDEAAIEATETVAGFEKADASVVQTTACRTLADADALATRWRQLNRPSWRVSPIERGILLLAACELKHHPETPYRVVINEAIELAKMFGGTDGHRFVNGCWTSWRRNCAGGDDLPARQPG